MSSSRKLWLVAVPVLVLSSCNSTPTTPEEGGPETGAIQVNLTTTGDDLDNQYTVSIGSSNQQVQTNGSVTFSKLSVGSRTVGLGDIAANCQVTGSASQSVSVTAGQTATVAFAVVCEAIPDVDEVLDDATAALGEALKTAVEQGGLGDPDAFTFEDAHSLFSEALEREPTNTTAAFGVAVTTIFILEENDDVRRLADEWQAWLESEEESDVVTTLMGPAMSLTWRRGELPIGVPAGTIHQVAHSGAVATRLPAAPSFARGPTPSLVDAQALLMDVVRPAVENALEALEAITDPEFIFIITEEMQGEDPSTADPLELDYTDVLLLRAGLEATLAAIDVATAYSLEPNPSDVQGFVDALTPGSAFLTLRPDGAAKLANALPHLRASAGLLLDGIDELLAETDDQSDDVIKYGEDGFGGVSAEDVTDARAVVEDVERALLGPTTIILEEEDEDTDEVAVTVDATRFFLNPIEDFKAVIPAYEVFTATEGSETVAYLRWTALNIDEWTVPDPTFGGILPDMSSTRDLIDTLGADEFFFDFSIAGSDYALVSVDGTDCMTASGGAGCDLGGELYHDGWIYLEGYDGTQDVSIGLYGYSSFVGLQGSYRIEPAEEGTYTLAFDLMDGTGDPVSLTATLVDSPGFTSEDSFERRRGGSSITFSYLGSELRFEKQR